MSASKSSATSLTALRVPLAMLLLLPIAPVLAHFGLSSQVWVFCAGAVAVAVLADWIRRATDHLATHLGPAIGGLLNVSLGSLAELILAFFVLRDGHVDVVRAQITGSIIGTGLLGLGIAVVVGAVGRPPMRFDRGKAGPLASLLILVVIALLLPALFHFTAGHAGTDRGPTDADEALSIGVSIVMLLVYAANLVYTLVSRNDVFASSESRDDEASGVWPLWVAGLVLVAATAIIAFEAELVSGALQSTAEALGLSSIFIGVVILALVGTTSDLFAATWFARQGKPGLVMNLCVGSSIQVALVVAPVLVIGSWLLGKPMTLIFRNPLDLFAIAGTAFTVNAISSDGELTWFEGVLLVGVYVLLCLAFFFSSPP